MNIAKFIVTVLFTMIYTSAIWMLIYFDSTWIFYPLLIIITLLGGILIILLFRSWIAYHWDD